MVHLIWGLKHDLGDPHFVTEEDLQSVVAEEFFELGDIVLVSVVVAKEFCVKQDADCYKAGIHKLILHCNNCHDEQGDYVEK